ncbi:MAG: molybdate ABC transporter permease subunit [Meiothermus sp.]|uniref:molybdate ABC transporter permease subunit n=1 Tax=Meiothermus sp. TaxID=1955249 RepID=UPI0025D08772|nr:molybdate ABC transporter permease subunit [Meiothermus sp.]MCS7058220.1 molybdate ABC transporter permease subunit [Meiothermus sp.]MCS7194731.1 molybdate ABC transporter permease subunit [Meiothermus sp.]MCX7739480.1 molybdate ABC transporter permease subunit [Meiothermus sp.]MDW8091416.1 molybdate ABC transporter permease subunit [Meiothermus sp.]MDW8481346.1 molybdate ABC transporter permease subunit [Meiothermus sp.]
MSDPVFWETLGLTLRVSLLSTLILLLMGVPLAWVLAHKRFWGKRVVESVVLLPLTLPPTVLGFYLLLLLGQNGPIAQVLGFSWAFRFEGLVVGSVLFSLPFALNGYREAFRGLEPDLIQTARTLGAGWLRVWLEVILPLTWPGILSGSILAFAHTLGEFGVVLMVGGSIPGKTQMVSIYIYDQVQALRFDRANQAAGVLLLISFALVYLVRSLEDRWKSRTPSSVR